MTLETPATDPPAMPPALPEGRFTGRCEFTDLVRHALQTAAQEGWSRIVLCDADFADWPLGERAVVNAFHAWSARGRSLQLLAREYSTLRQLHPRFVEWRVTWSHLVEAQVCANAPAGELPSVLWSPAWTLQRLDPVHSTMVASRSAERRVALQENLAAWWQKGSPGFPASTLGL